MRSPCRIGAGSGYWGDIVDPAVELIEQGEISYICFDLLAELTISILQRTRQRDPEAGYVPDVEPILREALDPARRHGVGIVTNGGGANPLGGARAAARVACELGHGDARIGLIEGDDLFDRLQEIRAGGWKFANLDTGEEDIDRVADRVVAASAYTGSDGVIAALDEGADVVIGGRLADSALYCGPLMRHFGWSFEEGDWERIGAALTVGHVLECGAIASGGMSSQWRLSRDPWRIGFPLAEMYEDGTATIEKVPGSGGVINQYTIKEHLLYEVHDPFDYRLPDGIVDMADVEVEEVGEDRVRVTGMSGRERPDTLKVQIGYENGWIAEGRAVFPWPDALEKAEWSKRLVRERMRHVGVTPLEERYDRVGIDSLAGPAAPPPPEGWQPNEVELRMVARCATRAEAEAARRAMLLPATLGPVGTAFGLPIPVRKVIALWPTLVPRELVQEKVRVAAASELVAA
jgi:Acyclic terpene utilisation family protein AtuA